MSKRSTLDTDIVMNDIKKWLEVELDDDAY